MQDSNSKVTRPLKKGAKKKVIPNEAPDDPHRLSKCFIDKRCLTRSGERTLVWWRGEWWSWDGAAYHVLPLGEFKADLSTVVKKEFDRLNLEELKRPREKNQKPPTARKVTKVLLANVITALESLCICRSTIEQPSWLAKNNPFPAVEVFATQSGLIHIPSLDLGNPKIRVPTPQFFSPSIVDYEFVPRAECPNWLAFLTSLWGSDPQSIDCLQEWFGYFLLPDISQQKMLVIIGPPRSGKGTIARVLTSLIGVRNICTPKLSSFGNQFGLWPLLGKTVGIFADARIGRSADAIAVLEPLLSITGGDLQDIQRKCLPTLPGIRLLIRFLLMTNELPNLPDSSGAFTTRIIMLRMIKSFVDEEDTQLASRLLGELPGILNWSITGWQRLQSRGHFLQPDTGRELLFDLKDLTSPISHFAREMCIIGPEFKVRIDDLFKAWKTWNAVSGEDRKCERAMFGKNLRAAFPQLTESQPRTSDRGRPRIYIGIGLRSGTGWHECQSIASEEEIESAITQVKRDSLDRVPARAKATHFGNTPHD